MSFLHASENTYFLGPESSSAGAPGHRTHVHNLELGIVLGQPSLKRPGLATQDELDRLYQQAMRDMYSDTFRGIAFFMSAYGEKPS
jgi:hypothetical protein